VKFVEYPDQDLMMLDLADTLTAELGSALRQSESVSFSVPGGTTPGPVFDVLAEQDLAWDRITVFLNDERWVPEDHPRSNAALIRKKLLRSKASAANFIPFFKPDGAPEDVLDEIGDQLRPHLPISVLLLGMGADMHTASLFPGADRLEAALRDDAPIVMALRAEGAGEPRVSLSAPVLKGALATHLVLTGEEKRTALMRARDLPVLQAPVRAVLGQATVHWAP
jgi:6-phosphogluconolactonase